MSVSNTGDQDGGSAKYVDPPPIDIDDVAQKRLRVCSMQGCSTSVSAFCLDPHTRCYKCRGDNPCLVSNQCDECATWSPYVMANTSKHFLKMRAKWHWYFKKKVAHSSQAFSSVLFVE